MLNRRTFMAVSAATAAAMLLPHRLLANPDASVATAMATRPIPSTGERIPVIGMGTSGSFEVGTSDAERDPLREVLSRFITGGGALIDTAPSYGPAETVLGELLNETGLKGRVFLATKIAQHDRAASLAEFERSLRRLQSDTVDLLQIHNLRDLRTNMALLRDLKAKGRTRYIGVTHYLDSAHDELARVVAAERPDFLQINYSVASRNAEKRLLPLAEELGVAVLINRAFEDGKLFARVAGKPLPEAVRAAGVSSWAQAFLKFALSHPAVTAVIPATGKPDRQTDNLRAGSGPRLDDTQRRALIAAIG